MAITYSNNRWPNSRYDIPYMEKNKEMKLNKYICEKLTQIDYAVTEDDIEEWICEWYMSTFKEINCGSDGNPRLPPTWLAGPRWYDRRRRMMKEAQEEEDVKKTSEV